mgnify:FL=1
MLLASCTLDDMVKIIDVSSLRTRIKDDFNEEEYEQSIVQNLKPNHGKVPTEEKKKTDSCNDNEEDWDDDSDDDSDMEDSSDDETGKKTKQKKKDKGLNQKNATLNQSKKMREDKHREDFFGDL